jgi:hypothetical protein
MLSTIQRHFYNTHHYINTTIQLQRATGILVEAILTVGVYGNICNEKSSRSNDMNGDGAVSISLLKVDEVFSSKHC